MHVVLGHNAFFRSTKTMWSTLFISLYFSWIIGSMNIGLVVDFPGRKPYCVLSIDVICRNLASINRSHSFIEWHISWCLGSYCTLVYISFSIVYRHHPALPPYFWDSLLYYLVPGLYHIHDGLFCCFASILTASIGRSSGPVALSSPIFPSCSDTSFSLNMSIGPPVAKPLSIYFLVFSVLSNHSKYVSHLCCMISLSIVSIWPSKLLMTGIS